MAAAPLSAAQALNQVQEEPTTSTSVSEWFTPSTVSAMVLILVLISGYLKRRQTSNDSRRGESFSPLFAQDQHLILIISADAVSTNGSNGRHSNGQSVWPLEGVTVLPLDVINPAPISPSSLPSRPPLAYYPSNTCRRSTTMPVSRSQQRLAMPKRTSSCPSQRQRCVTRLYATYLSSQLIHCKQTVTRSGNHLLILVTMLHSWQWLAYQFWNRVWVYRSYLFTLGLLHMYLLYHVSRANESQQYFT